MAFSYIMKEIVQFYRIKKIVSLDISSKLGAFGKIVGIRASNYLPKSYIVEFSDNLRLCLLVEEIRIVPGE